MFFITTQFRLQLEEILTKSGIFGLRFAARVGWFPLRYNDHPVLYGYDRHCGEGSHIRVKIKLGKRFMNIQIKIVADKDVFDLLEDKIFIARWEELARAYKKVTVQQEAPFVTTWYRIYLEKYQPILILGYNENTELVGLIPLAFSRENKYLTHAGDWQAEYKGWLSTREADQYFPIHALIAIKNHFPVKKWNWGWISPRSDINWLSSNTLRREKIYVKVTEEDSPVLDLSRRYIVRATEEKQIAKN